MYACIDLGSNSFHLLIGEWENGRIRIIERCSEKVQLSEGVSSSGKVSSASFERGLVTLQHFKFLMDRYPIQQYWALGTNTFRVTKNASDFVKAAAKLGIDISIISGVQEGVLIYAGVITALPVSDVHRLIIDIGGGSTEVIVGRSHERLMTRSLAIGSMTWRDRFFDESSLSVAAIESQMDLGVAAALEIFQSIARELGKVRWNEVYASSGTAKMLAAVCHEQGFGQSQISYRSLQEVKSTLATTIAMNSGLSGLKERRRDLLLPGWCILSALMETYEIKVINLSTTALREGMLDFMVKNKKTLPAMEQSGLPNVSFANA
jgi:exopolyphosphatase/guanosine-5'-triphosphate,3'-diphosphate pyrophosphatase